MATSVTHRQPPFPALGILKKFLDKENGQAEIHYNFKDGRHSVVNRPLSLISKIVSATKDIPPQGLLFDPLIVNDFLQQEDAERLEAELAGDGERGDEDGGGHADTDQQVGRGELGAVQDVTAAISEDGLESAQDQGEQANILPGPGRAEQHFTPYLHGQCPCVRDKFHDWLCGSECRHW